jgi:hypothetical protein
VTADYRLPVGLALALAMFSCTWAVRAQPAVHGGADLVSLPDIVTPPKALNLGSTSYFDGFGRTTEGWTWLQYARAEDIDEITDYQGKGSASLKGTRIPVFLSLTQFSYMSDLHPFGGDGIGFSAALPVSSLNASFAADSPVKLRHNGPGLGDLVWGPIYQSRVFKQGGRPVLSARFQLIIESPTGNFSRRDNINQSAGYWAVNPYIAATYLPLPGLEFSTRFNYQYNCKTSNLPAPPPIPGIVYRNGQAGQIIYDNYDASLQLSDKLHLGLNGYFLDELTPDRTNGTIVPHSRETEIYLGPGGRYVFDAGDALNVNFYFPLLSRNGSRGAEVNLQFVKKF